MKFSIYLNFVEVKIDEFLTATVIELADRWKTGVGLRRHNIIGWRNELVMIFQGKKSNK